MTLAALKEVLQDRINALVGEFEPIADIPSTEQNRWQAGYIEGRLEEARVALRLVDRLQLEEEHPLLELERDGRVRRVADSDGWGEQQRGDWPASTFGRLEIAEYGDPNDPIAGTDSLVAMGARHDGEEC